MSLVPPTLLRWKEPPLAGGAANGLDRRRLYHLGAAVLVGAFIFIWYVSRIDPQAIPRVLVALGVIVVTIAVIVFMYQTGPAWVGVSETGIWQGLTDETGIIWKFNEIEHCELVSLNVGTGRLSLLIIQSGQGKRSTLGIDPSVSLTELVALLESKNVRVMRDVPPVSAPVLSQEVPPTPDQPPSVS